jgi:uncharacterized protein with FMN-binding domain
MTGIIVALVIAVSLGVGGGMGWSRVSKEHAEAGNVQIADVNFATLRSGTYEGTYEGGMYKWRAATVQVFVDSGKVKNITLLRSSDPGKKNTNQALLFDRVVQSQSLQVDVISGATLTSKAYLKSVENALVKAQKE